MWSRCVAVAHSLQVMLGRLTSTINAKLVLLNRVQFGFRSLAVQVRRAGSGRIGRLPASVTTILKLNAVRCGLGEEFVTARLSRGYFA